MSDHVASHISNLPCRNGNTVTSSGRRPSSRSSPTGFSTEFVPTASRSIANNGCSPFQANQVVRNVATWLVAKCVQQTRNHEAISEQEQCWMSVYSAKPH